MATDTKVAGKVAAKIVDTLASDKVAHLVANEMPGGFKMTGCNRWLSKDQYADATPDNSTKDCPYCLSGETAPRKIPSTKKVSEPAPVLPDPEFAGLRDKLGAAYADYMKAQSKRDGGRNVRDDQAAAELIAKMQSELKPFLPKSRGSKAGALPGVRTVTDDNRCDGSGQAPKPGTVRLGSGGKWNAGKCPVCNRRCTVSRKENKLVNHPKPATKG